MFLAALLPRLYVAIAWAREPVWDGHYYDFGARRLAAGLGYSDASGGGWHPWCHYPVGYSAFLAGIYRVFGPGPHVATVANALVGALLAVVVHRLARYGTSERRALIAGLLVALSPGLIVYAALVMTEPLAALGLVTSAWLAARDAQTRPLRGALAGGVALGLTALVRPQSLVCAPALALFALASEPDARLRERLLRAAKTATVALAAAFAVIAPWTARNCRVMDGCALVSTNAGWNLAIGAFPRATGRFETLHATDGCSIVTGQVQQDRCWLDAGVGWIKADPARWLSLVPRKLSETFDHESFPMGYLGEADPRAWPEERKAHGRELLTKAHWALMVAAALGVLGIPSRRRRRESKGEREDASSRKRAWLVQGLLAALVLGIGGYAASGNDQHHVWPLALFIPIVAALRLAGSPANGRAVGYAAFTLATVVVTHAVFFGEDRYHVVVTPLLCLLAACALRRSDERAAVDVR